MNDDKLKKNQQPDQSDIKPDPETLHTPDPQEEMKGPVSSTVRKIEKAMGSDETQEEADRKKERNM